MHFLNRLGPNNIHKILNNTPFVLFTLDEFHVLKHENDLHNKTPIEQLALNNETLINLVKYCFIMGEYTRGVAYLKNVKSYGDPDKMIILIDEMWKIFDELSSLQGDRLYWLKSNVKTYFNNVKNVYPDIIGSVLPKTLFSMLDVFYVYAKKERDNPNYNIGMWILIIKFLKHLKYLKYTKDLAGQPSYSFVQHSKLILYSEKVLMIMIRNDLVHILNCYGILQFATINWKTRSFFDHKKYIRRYIQQLQKRILEDPTNQNNRNALLKIYYTSNYYKNWPIKLLCLGVNFSCHRGDKIEIRNNFEKFKMILEQNKHLKFLHGDMTDVLVRWNSNENNNINRIIRKKLKNFKLKHSTMFCMSMSLSDSYTEVLKKIRILPNVLCWYHKDLQLTADVGLNILVGFINKFCNFVLEEQSYRIGSVGYVTARESFNNMLTINSKN